MGTNYYIGRHTGAIAHEDREQEMHIGKRSGGWAFQFQAKIAKNTADWRQRIDNMPGEYVIVDEYGHVWERHEFWAMVNATKGSEVRHVRPAPDRVWIDDEGHDFCNYAFC